MRWITNWFFAFRRRHTTHVSFSSLLTRNPPQPTSPKSLGPRCHDPPSQVLSGKKGTQMFCPECGKQIEENSLFCPECGAKIARQSQQPVANDTTAAEAGNTFASAASAFSSMGKTTKYGIICGSIAAVVLAAVIAIAVLVMPTFTSVPTDTARQAFSQNSFAVKGAISSEYASSSAYEVKDFKIDKQEDALADLSWEHRQTAKDTYGTDQIKTVYFSGTIANDSFETSFTGRCDFFNRHGSWNQVSSSSLKISSKSTKPLKGVDSMDQNVKSDNVSYSNFNSNLKESNGTYTSDATSTLAYKYWFATDTAKVSQSFTFDPSSGWKASGDATTTDQNTEWNLKDKTFEYSGNTGLFMNGTIDSSITFGEVSNESASASYVLDYAPSAGMSNSYTTYHSISLKGTAAGKPSHKFGSSDFSIQLSDSGQSVDIACEKTAFTYSSDDKNAFSVSMDTKAIYATYKGGSQQSYLGVSSRTFTESTQTNA